MSRRKQRKINIGEKYGHLQVISRNEDKSYLRYNCLCDCGTKFATSGQNILNSSHQSCGCKKERHIHPQTLEMIGKKYGQLSVTGVDHDYKGTGVGLICKCDCGNVVTISAGNLNSGNSKTCGHDTEKNLQKGAEVLRDGSIEGTNLYSIGPHRKINKNNTSGHKGVSKMKNGRYRAYIFFKRKWYHLGCFDNSKEALSARRRAEKEVHGEFIKWYKENYAKGEKDDL